MQELQETKFNPWVGKTQELEKKKNSNPLLLLFILFTAPIILLFTLSTVFAEPSIGKQWDKWMEEDLRSHRNVRHVYSRLASTTAVVADAT